LTMAHRQPDLLFRHLHRLVAAESSAISDQELLERFARHHEEAAFEALVQRHGPMVLRVCQGELKDQHLAEDAFQATFLVLVRKVSSIHKHTAVGSWLYKVAYHIALRARGAAAQRRQRESQVASPMTPSPLDDLTWRDLCAVLNEELQRLPAKYQAPVILCCLEGRARDEAAQQLGWSLGTVKGRLERGRELLRARLLRRGIALSAALGATLLPEGAGRASVPATLTSVTVRVALLWSSGREAAPTLISAQVNTLVHEATGAMALTRFKLTTALLLLVGTFVAGSATLAHQVLKVPEPDPQPVDETKAKSSAPDLPRLPQTARDRVDRNGDLLPAGAIGRLGTLRFRHMHTISSVDYSGNGTRILSGSWDGTVRLWDAATGQELRQFRGFREGISSVAISPDGTTLAGGTMGKTLFLWDAATGKELFHAEHLENTVFGLRFAPDGKTLAGVSGDTVRLWDAATGAALRQLAGPKKDMRPFAFSTDLKTFAAGLPDRSIQLWDLTSGTEARRWPSQQAGLSCLAISPDGKVLASGGTEHDRTVRLWNTATNQEIRRFGPYRGWVQSLTFAPDGKALAAGEQVGMIHIYETASGKERCRCSLREGSWVRGLAFSPDGRTLAAGGTNERAIRFFDAATGEEQHLADGHQNEIVAAALMADRRTLVSAGKDGLVCLWDLNTGKEAGRWKANDHGISTMALAPDGRTLVIAGDPILRLCDTTTGTEVRQLVGHPEAAGGVTFSSDGRTLASGSWRDHTIRLWDVASSRERLQIKLPMPRGHNYGPIPLVFAAGGKVLISGSADRMNNSIYFWDPDTGKELQRLARPVSYLALSPDGKILATTSWDKHVRLWDVATAKETVRVAANASVVAFSPDVRMLAYGGTDGMIHLWEVAAGQERHTFTGHQPGGDERGSFAAGVAALAFASDSRTLISGGGDTTLLVWEVFSSAGLSPTRLTPQRMETLWSDLAADAPKAYEAIAALVAARGKAVTFLKAKLHPAVPCESQRLARLIAELDSNEFAVRKRATDELKQLNESVIPELRKALARHPSPEARHRLEEVLSGLENLPRGDRLRSLRAVETLEHLATSEARHVLQLLTKGAREARLTRDAKASLERLSRRPGTPFGKKPQE
jgi:RNA polymerase sigma factor (sigma-70 family)